MAFTATVQRDLRSAERHAVALEGTLRDGDWQPFDVVVEDLSVDGFCVPAVADLAIGSCISLGLPGVGARPATVVRLAAAGYGCRFATPLDDRELVATLKALGSDPLPFPIVIHDGPNAAPERVAEPIAMEAPAFSRTQRTLFVAACAASCWLAVLGIRLLAHS